MQYSLYLRFPTFTGIPRAPGKLFMMKNVEFRYPFFSLIIDYFQLQLLFQGMYKNTSPLLIRFEVYSCESGIRLFNE